ncbi:MAG: hypothetical protein ACM3JQ_05275 [Candidatus Eiseniibacteriota bacterium]
MARKAITGPRNNIKRDSFIRSKKLRASRPNNILLNKVHVYGLIYPNKQDKKLEFIQTWENHERRTIL